MMVCGLHWQRCCLAYYPVGKTGSTRTHQNIDMYKELHHIRWHVPEMYNEDKRILTVALY